ncbi:MAG: hypothetical protein H6Q41_1234 [Deltaproteobacteria bacterium]|jgi:hypothetical protein|nr:hypothetical protein [Deltaproteobacteria bacterium]
MREYPEANIESVILTKDDESWYSQAGFCMVESVVNLFAEDWSHEELGRIDETLNLLKIQFSKHWFKDFVRMRLTEGRLWKENDVGYDRT